MKTDIVTLTKKIKFYATREFKDDYDFHSVEVKAMSYGKSLKHMIKLTYSMVIYKHSGGSLSFEGTSVEDLLNNMKAGFKSLKQKQGTIKV